MPKSTGILLLAAAMAAGPAAADDAAAARAMDQLLASHHRADAPGCAAGVYRGGTLLHAGAFGMANLELEVPITAASAFDIGSTSKQFTAASALLLARDGKLSLDDDVRRHVPELPAYASAITLGQLLHHTGGVRDYIDLLRMSGAHVDDVTTAQRAVELLALQQGTHFTPGERHEYSNSGYFLVALAIERASGQSLREFARQRLFEPLGMRHTLYRDDHAELVPGRAMAYAKDEKKGWRLDVSNWEQMGDGGIVTTVGDLAKWNGNFHAPVVGSASLLQDLHERGTLNDGTRLDYALGLMHGTYKGHPTVQHGGSWGGYIANLVRYPGQQLGIAVLCNSEDQPLNALLEQIADLYLPAGAAAGAPGSTDRQAVPLDPERLREWVGSYRFGMADIATFALGPDGLAVQVDEGTYPLRPVGDRAMLVGNLPVEVLLELEPASQGQPRRILQSVNGKRDRTGIAFEPAKPAAAALQPLAGVYHCPEVQADYRVQVTDATLALVTPRGDSVPMAPFEARYFAGERMYLRFPPAGRGAPATMEIGTQRAQGLQCERRTGPVSLSRK